MFTVRYTDRALRSLQKIPYDLQTRIIKAIDGLASDPYRGKQLKGRLSGLFSLRVWPYRIIYCLEKKEITVVILDIGHRQGVYK